MSKRHGALNTVQGTIYLTRGRVVHFRLVQYRRPRKVNRWVAWYEWEGKRYTGTRLVALQWFRTEAAALAATTRRFRPRNGKAVRVERRS
jgi:hypothetical protein